MKIFALCLAGLVGNHVALAENMNQHGAYKIANSEAFDTTYSKDREFFDVYSKKIVSRYSEVHWRGHGAIPLPDHIIERFADGKVMAVTGYEVDQVMKMDSGEEKSVPISWAYNHHYCARLINSKKAKLVRKKATHETAKLGMNHGAEEYYDIEVFGVEDDDEIPKTHFFSEGNGGEMRKSYHGYPKGYAQNIESPDTFHIQPMQIDTWNREMKDSKFIPGPRPKSSRVTPDAGYNGLLECPCSDRLEFDYGMTYVFDDSGNCKAPVQDSDECFAAVKKMIKSAKYEVKTVSNSSLPSGCSGTLNSDGHVDAVWNTATEEPKFQDEKSKLVGNAIGVVNMTVSIDETKGDKAVQLTISGPADKWFGVGFGSSSMCIHMEADECAGGGPYAVIVSGDNITERKLDFHGPGDILEGSFTMKCNHVKNGVRTVHLSRPIEGASDKHYTFDPTAANIPLIMAKGCDLPFAQHCGHGPSDVNLMKADTPKGICQGGVEGTIDGNKFSSIDARCPAKDRPGYPKSMLFYQNNPTCRIETYRGGLSCCRDGKYLLDKDQEIPWQDQPLEYYLKFRFYFEEFKRPSQPREAASHKELVRLYWQTENYAGEYDIPECKKGTPPSQCVHELSARFKLSDVVHSCSLHDATWCTGKGSNDPAKTEGVKLIYAGPHCHAGTCLSMELYNADTGRLLCHMEPVFGKGEKEKYDESGYVALPPCLWGDAADGLMEPELLPLNTTLLSIKRSNNTFYHTGEMASWQMRAIVVPKEEKEEKDEFLESKPLLRSRTWVEEKSRREDEISN